MDWYYAEEGQQRGPVNESDFQNLVNMGRIKGSTLVWRSGMSDWKPWSEVAASAGMGGAASGASIYSPGPTASSAPVSSSPFDYSGGGGGGASPSGGYGSAGGSYGAAGGDQPMGGGGYGAAGGYGGSSLPQSGTVFCSQCGRPHPAEEMVELFNQAVCPNCKPYFLQRMQEGAVNYGTMMGMRTYGGFWIRFVAKIIDNLIMMVANMIVQMPFNLMAGSGGTDEVMALMFFGGGMLLSFAVQCAYVTFFLGKYGATPGKMACGLRVIVADGSRVTYMRGFARYWAEVLTGLTCTIGYIIAAFDEEKRALHDHICSTRVIKVR